MKTKEVLKKLYEDHKQKVSRYTLFKYERMGLITPFRKTFCRFYSTKDYMDITICVLLSTVGVPLDLVKDLLIHKDISVLGKINRMIDEKGFASNKAKIEVEKRYKPLRIYY